MPDEHDAPVAVLRRLVGAPDTVAFPLPGPLGRQTGLGQRPSATQRSLAAAVPAPAD